ncbi:hypothetical protein HZ994_12795 [Akkermansiaceae bacterium]|nr:hypothetical protein HZ994_12795 [Akkermansiaceae bacterium]
MSATLESQAGNRALPQFIRDMIASPPSHGEGVHQWLFKIARQLHAHRSEDDIADLLAAVTDGCGRHVPASEIADAIAASRECAWRPTGGTRTASKPAPKFPAVNEAARAEIITRGFTLADLRSESPIVCTPDSTNAEFIADELFPGNPLLCVGRNNAKFSTEPRESFRGKLAEMSLIVPSPMSALTGKRKKDGKPSAHTLDNTGERHYLVTEFDSGTSDEQAAIIWHLKEFAPLVIALSSGGKSLHAWWDCRGITGNITAYFFRYAVSLGADPATWRLSQFVRLPQGWRHDKKRRQEVYFFDPSAKGSEQ